MTRAQAMAVISCIFPDAGGEFDAFGPPGVTDNNMEITSSVRWGLPPVRNVFLRLRRDYPL